MNKTEMIAKIAEETGFTKKDVTAVVETMVDTVVAAVAAGDEVKIAGLGKFGVADRAAREGRNPQTGETMQIAASKAPKFKASKTFKDAVKAE